MANQNRYELIFFVIVAAIVVIVNIVKTLSRRLSSERDRRERDGQMQPTAAPQSPQASSMDEVRKFLDEIRRQTAEALGETSAPPAPPHPPPSRPTAPSQYAPRPTAAPHRPAGRPRPAPATTAHARRRVAEGPVVVLKEVSPPPGRKEKMASGPPAPPLAGPQQVDARKLLAERLPKDELKRAIVAREIFGPPRALARGPWRRRW